MKYFYHPDQAYHAPPTGQPVPSPEGQVRANLAAFMQGFTS